MESNVVKANRFVHIPGEVAGEYYLLVDVHQKCAARPMSHLFDCAVEDPMNVHCHHGSVSAWAVAANMFGM